MAMQSSGTVLLSTRSRTLTDASATPASPSTLGTAKAQHTRPAYQICHQLPSFSLPSFSGEDFLSLAPSLPSAILRSTCFLILAL